MTKKFLKSLKVGDYIECSNNSFTKQPAIKYRCLTIGKKYRIVLIQYDCLKIRIIDDDGSSWDYDYLLFEDVKLQRKKKLKKLYEN